MRLKRSDIERQRWELKFHAAIPLAERGSSNAFELQRIKRILVALASMQIDASIVRKLQFATAILLLRAGNIRVSWSHDDTRAPTSTYLVGFRREAVVVALCFLSGVLRVSSPSHASLIQDQFSRQAALFAGSDELHTDDQVRLLVDAAQPSADDISLDVACGPGSIVAAFAPHVKRAVGLDATNAMLARARALMTERGLANVAWRSGDVYALPFEDASFDIVTARFAFHHFEAPEKALAEMCRVCRSGGRIVVCDGIASADPGKAESFNAMERFRDPSTIAFRTLAYFMEIFAATNLGKPRITPFRVVYQPDVLAAHSFPVNDDRAELLRQIQALITTDANDAGMTTGGPFVYPTAVLTARKS